MTRWREFEQLAGRILSELRPNADVTVDDHLHGHESGGPRQIDVSIRQRLDEYDILIVVQARDRSTPADINDVGEFASVIRDVRASKGVLVCRSGFTRRAKAYAQNIGIDLLNLHDAESREWRQDVRIPLLWIDLSPVVRFELTARFDGGDTLSLNASRGWAISPDEGATVINPMTTFERSWNEGSISRLPNAEHTLRDSRPLTVLVEAADGRQHWRPMDDFRLVYTVRERAWLGHVSPEVCRGVVDYLQDEAFIVSHLPLGQMPTERDESWASVQDPRAVVVSTRGTLVTSEAAEVLVPGSGRAELSDYRYLGPNG